jgi:hypothetical protein
MRRASGRQPVRCARGGKKGARKALVAAARWFSRRTGFCGAPVFAAL